MAVRFNYDFRTDKRGRPYAVKLSVKTGKVIQKVAKPQKIKAFKKRVQSQKYREKQVKLNKKVAEISQLYNGDQADIKKRYQNQLAKEIAKEKARLKLEKEKGKKPLGRKRKTLEKTALRKVEKATGYVTTYRIWWVVKEGTNTPYVWAQRAERKFGDFFDEAVDYVDEISDPIIAEVKGTRHMGFVKGSGVCVRLIDRQTNRDVRQYELEAGCARH